MRYGDLDRYIHAAFKEHRDLESLSKPTWIDVCKRLYRQPRIRIMSRFCPTGLGVRYYCLLNILFVGEKDYGDQIHRLMSQLSCGWSLWVEGYTLWKKTKRFVNEWLNLCAPESDVSSSIRRAVEKIDHNFIETAYRRNGTWYPAPFGYLVDEPIERCFQGRGPVEPQNSTVTAGPLRKVIGATTINYVISGVDVKNRWAPKQDRNVRVINGFPYGFRYQAPQQNGDNQTEYEVGE